MIPDVLINQFAYTVIAGGLQGGFVAGDFPAPSLIRTAARAGGQRGIAPVLFIAQINRALVPLLHASQKMTVVGMMIFAAHRHQHHPSPHQPSGSRQYFHGSITN